MIERKEFARVPGGIDSARDGIFEAILEAVENKGAGKSDIAEKAGRAGTASVAEETAVAA